MHWATWITHVYLLALQGKSGNNEHAGESLRFLALDCVTVPGREAAFLVARQRFPYRSRFNFSVENVNNMLLRYAICDVIYIDFIRKPYSGANDASHWLLIEVHKVR